MKRTQIKELWIERGYEAFARHGAPGINVEAISRDLGLNKSGFYRNFISRELYVNELAEHHFNMISLLAGEVSEIEEFHPDFVNILIKYRVTMIAQMQMILNRDLKDLHACALKASAHLDRVIFLKWMRFTGLPQNAEKNFKYFEILRDAFYSRISWADMNYDYLTNLIMTQRILINDFRKLDLEEPNYST